SDWCGWDELAVSDVDLDGVCGELDRPAGWSRRWTATWRSAGGEGVCPGRDLGSLPSVGCGPGRRFSWHRVQLHRSGVQVLVSTGRHHGFESLAEERLLLALDFAGELVDVLGQPLRLGYLTSGGAHEHVPDFLAWCRTGRWLIDVRPAGRIQHEDLVAFA